MIILMRHGYTDYLQGNAPVTIEDANDLNDEGIKMVTRSSQQIAEFLQTSTRVVIYSSPLGRAIHTAKILKNHLDIEARPVELVLADELIELHNFRWNLFEETVLCSGIDTEGLPKEHWASLDLIHHLPDDVMRQLPDHLKNFVDAVESTADGGKRLMGFVNSTSSAGQDSIYVTHDGLLCRMLMELTNNQRMTCTRSHYFEIVPVDSGWKLGRTNLS